MRLRNVLLRVWLDKGGEEVDERAQERERELADTEGRVKKLGEMWEVKLRRHPGGESQGDIRQSESRDGQ